MTLANSRGAQAFGGLAMLGHNPGMGGAHRLSYLLVASVKVWAAPPTSRLWKVGPPVGEATLPRRAVCYGPLCATLQDGHEGAQPVAAAQSYGSSHLPRRLPAQKIPRPPGCRMTARGPGFCIKWRRSIGGDEPAGEEPATSEATMW